jgi:hypothetical protein
MKKNVNPKTTLCGSNNYLTRDFRGNHKRIHLNDTYPELVVDAKAYAVNECLKKSYHLTIMDLTRFIEFVETGFILKTINARTLSKTKRICR